MKERYIRMRIRNLLKEWKTNIVYKKLNWSLSRVVEQFVELSACGLVLFGIERGF